MCLCVCVCVCIYDERVPMLTACVCGYKSQIGCKVSGLGNDTTN